MKILLTGFEPFNNQTINPSAMILENVTAPSNIQLVKMLLPVEFDKSRQLLLDMADKEKPDVILSLGQAGNVPCLSVERVAINLDSCIRLNGEDGIADNAGVRLKDKPISPEGPEAYFSTLPVWEIIEEVKKKGIKICASYSAGTYVCNHVMYTALEYAAKNKIRAGFVHVPFLPSQLGGEMVRDGRYAMEFKDMLRGVQTIVETLVSFS